MRNLTKMALLAAALATSAAAFAADFNGSWVRDGARSKAAPYPNYWLTRAPAAGGFNPNAPFVVRVQQSATGVIVTHPLFPQRSYVLDGKAHSSRADSGLVQVSTTAAMAGDTLKVTTVQPFGGMPGNVTMTATETWSLSPDGKELTITTVREVPATTQSFTEVFKKQ